MWTRDEEHMQIVQQAWHSNNVNLQDKLQNTLDCLSHWGKQKFGNLPNRIKRSQDELQHLNEQMTHNNQMIQIREKEKEIDELLQCEEMWWQQRSRTMWLKHGDKNTAYFHQKAAQRKRKNKIDSITDKQSNIQTSHDKIEETLVTHFKDLFQSQETHHINDTVEVVKNSITEDMFNHLNADFNNEEVLSAIREMKGLAAPGPDGLPALFFTKLTGISLDKM
jgi:hypothetical protein